MTDFTNLTEIETLLFYWSLLLTVGFAGFLTWYNVTEKPRRDPKIVVMVTRGDPDDYLCADDLKHLQKWIDERDKLRAEGKVHTPRWEALEARIVTIDPSKRYVKPN